MNFIITCQRNLEDETIQEIQALFDEFGDSSLEVKKTKFSGIVEVSTHLEIFEVIKKIREKISEEPWSIRFCSRIIPIQKQCDSEMESIKENVKKMISCIMENQSYRITIEKRDSTLKSKEVISEIADLIPNKVSLEHSDWEIIIQIMSKITGISILPRNSILSISKEKRFDSNQY